MRERSDGDKTFRNVPCSPCRVNLWPALILLSALLTGCGAEGVTGGTPGRLRADGDPLPDVQVNAFRVENGTPQPVGSGVTRSDGSFELVQPNAAGPLTLAPGEYRFTLESVGAPVILPKAYQSAEQTPLNVTFVEGTPLELEVTGVKLRK